MAVCEGIPSSGKVSLISTQRSTDWTRPTHIMEGYLLYPPPTKSANLNANFI